LANVLCYLRQVLVVEFSFASVYAGMVDRSPRALFVITLAFGLGDELVCD
jgi:hypothetical protein